jgi:hypothetical protein
MQMADKLSTGEKVAGVSAVLLFVFMFFDWFGVKVSGVTGFSGELGGGNAWDTLDFIPLVLIVTVIAALVMVGVRLADSDFEPVVPMSMIVTVLGALSVLLVLYRVIDPPNVTEVPGVDIDVTRKLGLFLGLLASIGVAYGGYRTMEEEGATFGDAADRLDGPGADAPPPPPTQQTPPPPPPPTQEPPTPPSSTPPPPSS